MRVTVFSAHGFELPFLEEALPQEYELVPLKYALSPETAIMAAGSEVISVFVNDDCSAPVLDRLCESGVRCILLRSAGFNHVDLKRAAELGIFVANVPAYSPYAVAEHAVALMMALNRRLIRAHNRVSDLNFSLDGLTGFDFNGKTVGIIGVGKIGEIVAKIMNGFGCHVLVVDPNVNANLVSDYNVEYVDIETLCKKSDIITLHAPLLPNTKYMINRKSIAWMKDDVMLINTSRGGLVNTKDVINALKRRKIGYLGLDVYEEEQGLFFEDHSSDILEDDKIARLMTFPNVLITSHQAFLTKTALKNIADTTIDNLICYKEQTPCENKL